MGGIQKKPVGLLAAVVLIAAMLVVGAAQPTSTGTESGTGESTVGPAQPLQPQTQPGSSFEKGLEFDTKPDYGIGRQELFIRTMLAALFVIVLGIGAIYVSKRLLPKLSNRPSKEIRVVETVHLGPRRAVHLVQVGGRRFLIGSTNENIRKLAEVTPGLTDWPQQDVDLGSEGT